MRLTNIFFGISMSNGHNGLLAHIKKKASVDGYSIFINKRWTALKMITPDNVILHLKTPDNRPIEPKSIKYLPACVNGAELDYSKALESALTKEYANLKKDRK